jgi:hypothetical protein
MDLPRPNYSSYKQLRSAGKVTLGIEHHAALKYDKWLPLSQRAAIYFWSWVAILLIPAAVVLGYFYSWWWLVLLVAHRIVWNANKESVAQFVLEFAEDNGWFYELVYVNDDWVYRWSEGTGSEAIGKPRMRATGRTGLPRPTENLSRTTAPDTIKCESPPVSASRFDSLDLDRKLSQYAANASHATEPASLQTCDDQPTSRASKIGDAHGENSALTQAAVHYVRLFHKPIPRQVYQDLAAKQVTEQQVLDRVHAALLSGQPDPEWDAYVPPPGSLEDLLVYQPLAKSALAKQAHPLDTDKPIVSAVGAPTSTSTGLLDVSGNAIGQGTTGLTIGKPTPRGGASKIRSAKPDDPIFSRGYAIGERKLTLSQAAEEKAMKFNGVLTPEEAEKIGIQTHSSVIYSPSPELAEKLHQVRDTRPSPGDEAQALVAEVVFNCSLCNEEAGRIQLFGTSDSNTVRRTSFMGILQVSESPEGFVKLRKAIEERDLWMIHAIDFELVPFLCIDCKVVYCGKHWHVWNARDDDGWVDSVRGRCPRGHERMLED